MSYRIVVCYCSLRLWIISLLLVAKKLLTCLFVLSDIVEHAPACTRSFLVIMGHFKRYNFSNLKPRYCTEMKERNSSTASHTYILCWQLCSSRIFMMVQQDSQLIERRTQLPREPRSKFCTYTRSVLQGMCGQPKILPSSFVPLHSNNFGYVLFIEKEQNQ